MRLKSIPKLLILCLLLAACGYPISTLPPGGNETQVFPTTYPEPLFPTFAPTSYPAPGIETPIPFNPPYPEPGTPVIPPSGFEPQPGDAQLTIDEVFLDAENSNLSIMESYPIQVSASLNGNLPDPCHQLRVVVNPADAKNQINLEVYSVVDPSMNCIMVIQPFNANIPLGSYPNGHYSVYVNGQLLGEFDA